MPIQLSGDRVLAREWRADDPEKIWALLQGHGPIFGPPGEITSVDDARSWVDKELAEPTSPDRTKYRFALELLDNGALMGGCRIHFEDLENRMVSIGMSLHTRYRSQGYGTEVGMLLLQLAFEQLGAHRVEALIDPSNEKSLGLVRKAGFVHEGLLRERILEEHWMDCEVFSLL